MKKIFTLFIAYTFIICSLNAQITIVYPSGGEKFIKNISSPHNIVWEAPNIENINIMFSSDNGLTWETIEENYSASDGHYDWLVNDLVSDNCQIKIIDANSVENYSESSVFSIVEPQIFYAKWNTSMGDFRAELRGDIVPITVQNFMNLCNKEFYTDLIFHRVISNFMIQDGCPLGNGTGDPGYEFEDEFDPRLRHNFPGILSMANAGPNTNGSQYFITVVPTTWLDDVHSIFGRIIDDMDIVFEISEVETNSADQPVVPVDIYSITIEEYNPELIISFPEDGASVIQNTDIEITWNSEFYADLRIEFSSDDGSTWETVSDSIPAHYQSFMWITPDVISTECKIKLTDLRNENNFVINSFEIKNKIASLLRFECYQDVEAPIENPENYFSTGEKFNFKVQIINNYSETLENISGVLTCDNEHVTFINNELTFSSVLAGEKVWSEQLIEIELDETTPPRNEYSFILTITENSFPDEEFISKFTIPLITQGPFGVIDDDSNPDSNGNNNKIIEADETVEVKINLQNKSSEFLYDTYGKIQNENTFINIWNEVQGVDGIVYDSINYNAIINPSTTFASPLSDFVFDYNEDYTRIFELGIIVSSYLTAPLSENYEESGILIKYFIPVIFNPNYPVKIEDNQDVIKNDFVVYPNPVSDYFEIIFNKTIDNHYAKVEISDVTGKIVLSEKINQNTDKIMINNNFNSGVYIITVYYNDNQTIAKKIIIK